MDSFPRAQVTVTTLQKMKQRSEKIAVVTSYDASFTTLLERAKVDVILVGDSLGMVVQGRDSTVGVSMDDMIYHCACVARGGESALRIADFPFMSYSSVDQALENAAKLMREGHAHMVKLEGGEVNLTSVEAITGFGIPVCGHLGLLPQSVNKLGGYRVQGRDEASAQQLISDARALETAGAALLVLECVPVDLARQVTEALTIPTIGIGAGVDCDGQVLVLYDLLGITPGKRPSFSRDFLAGQSDIQSALVSYVQAVKASEFPAKEHGFF